MPTLDCFGGNEMKLLHVNNKILVYIGTLIDFFLSYIYIH